MKNYGKLFLFICFAILALFVFISRKQGEQLSIEEDDISIINKSRKTVSDTPQLREPIVDQIIKYHLPEKEPIQLIDGFAKVQIQFSPKYKNTSDKNLVYTVVVYKDKTEIYRSARVEGQYLDFQFKKEENYQFYVFRETEMAFHDLKILETDTTIECTPQKKYKAVIIKNDTKSLFRSFNLGGYSFENHYIFRLLSKNESVAFSPTELENLKSFSISEIKENCFEVYPAIIFPSDFQTCQLFICNSNGFFSINKTFEEMYNDQPLLVEVPNLKEMLIKIKSSNDQNNLVLNLLPEKFIQSRDDQDNVIQLVIENSSAIFFSDLDFCKLTLFNEDIHQSKLIALKATLTTVEFKLDKEDLPFRKIILKNNQFKENIHLYQLLCDKKGSSSFLGQNFGITNELKMISPNVFEYPKIDSSFREALMFRIEGFPSNDNTEKADVSSNLDDKLAINKNLTYLGIDFFKGNNSEVIEIDFNLHKFYRIQLQFPVPVKDFIYLISLDEKYVQEIRIKGEPSLLPLLLRKGKYRVATISSDEDTVIFVNFDVQGDATIDLSKEFKNFAEPIQEENETDNEEILLVSFTSELPSRMSLFQILKNLNYFAFPKSNKKYNVIDKTYKVCFEDEGVIEFRQLEKAFSLGQRESLPNIRRISLESHWLNSSEIIFSKTLAPHESEINLIPLFNFSKEMTVLRFENDKFSKHVFLNNFEYLILPPLDKPDLKIERGKYGQALMLFSNPQHHLLSFEIIGKDEKIQNTNHIDFKLFDTRKLYTDNITNGSCFEFSFLEYGSYLLEISDLTIGTTTNYSFQISEKYQEIKIR